MRECNGKNICVDDYCEFVKGSEMYCRKPICDYDEDCGKRGICRQGRCFLACTKDRDCSKWVCIRMIFDLFKFYLLKLD